MAWYAYCITEQAGLQGGGRARRPFVLENLKGVNDSAVLAYPSGEFAVIVSEHASAKPLTQQAIVDHARVISECFRTVTVLPFRFGKRLPPARQVGNAREDRRKGWNNRRGRKRSACGRGRRVSP